MDADDEMAKQAEMMLKNKKGMKKAPLIKRDVQITFLILSIENQF